MRLVLYTNYLNHHQVPVADELYRLLGDDFRFVATLPRNEKESNIYIRLQLLPVPKSTLHTARGMSALSCFPDIPSTPYTVSSTTPRVF